VQLSLFPAYRELQSTLIESKGKSKRNQKGIKGYDRRRFKTEPMKMNSKGCSMQARESDRKERETSEGNKREKPESTFIPEMRTHMNRAGKFPKEQR